MALQGRRSSWTQARAWVPGPVSAGTQNSRGSGGEWISKQDQTPLAQCTVQGWPQSSLSPCTPTRAAPAKLRAVQTQVRIPALTAQSCSGDQILLLPGTGNWSGSPAWLPGSFDHPSEGEICFTDVFSLAPNTDIENLRVSNLLNFSELSCTSLEKEKIPRKLILILFGAPNRKHQCDCWGFFKFKGHFAC